MDGGRVAIVGSLNADLIVRTERRPAGGETVIGSDLAIGSGGKGANQAVAAARLGAEVAMLGALGDDAFGRQMRAAIVAEGIDDSAVVELPDAASGTAMIIVDAAGENSIVVSPGANDRLGPADGGRSSGPGSTGPRCSGCAWRSRSRRCSRRPGSGRDAGARVIVNLSPYAEVPAELLALTDLLLVNEHELALLLGDGPAAHVLAGPGPRRWPSGGSGGPSSPWAATGSVVLDPRTGPSRRSPRSRRCG